MGTLIVRARAGLGNRLCAFISARVLAESTGAALTIVWPPSDSNCFGAFSDLFDPSTLSGVSVVDGVEGSERWPDARFISGREIRQRLQRGETVRLLAYEFFGQDVLPGIEYHERCRQALHPGNLAEHVRRLVEEIPAPSVGLHIRMTDHLPCRFFSPRWCYRSSLACLHRVSPAERVLICTDTPAFARELETGLMNPSAEPPGRRGVRGRDNVQATQAALADLWLLSRCRVILASSGSSYARVASALGLARVVPVDCLAPRVLRRLIQPAWWISMQLAFDEYHDRWGIRASQAPHARLLLGPVALLFAKWITGARYQDRPSAGRRRRFEARLEPALAQALHAPLPSISGGAGSASGAASERKSSGASLP